MEILHDLTGKRFGRLVAIRAVGTNKHKKAIWLCKCDCGAEVEVLRGSLLRKDGKGARSCGCLWREAIAASNKLTKTTHGLNGTRIQIVWKGMISRCEKENTTGYENYGGRGIKVCDEWHDLTRFAEWALSTGYADAAKKGDCTIERVNVNGNYEPDNCKWVNMFEQNANRRNTVKVVIDGKLVPLMIAARDAGLDYRRVYKRIHDYGESFEMAVKYVREHEKRKRRNTNA